MTKRKYRKNGEFEPYKFVFIKPHVLELPSHNVDKQFVIKTMLDLTQAKKHAEEQVMELSKALEKLEVKVEEQLNIVQIPNPKTQYIV